ncbi:MAG: helix-turn-helix transcriptional regulator, partial [Lachnospiraceae bacterium]|nr:helix-turn-helix transcriptional regulator [Lachnospiraceae bacterium]
MLFDEYGKAYTEKSGVLKENKKLLPILDIFLEKALYSQEALQSNKDLIKVISYMAEHMQEKLTVEDIAAIIYMSPAAFSRAFHKHVSMPPITFLNELRLDKAKKLLSETDISISQIAEAVGFEDEFYFFKIFGRYVGVTPAVYRQKKDNS